MTTIAAPTFASNTPNTISVSVDKGLNSDAIMDSRNCNVVITQEDSMGASSTGGLPLTQDTISSVDFCDSQPQEPAVEDNAAVVTTTAPQLLSAPPLLVQCPKVSDVLFPMEGFTMWPANKYCNDILQQHESEFKAISNHQERQAQLILGIIRIIQSQPQSSNGANDTDDLDDDHDDVRSGGRFLKAIQVPYRTRKLNQTHQRNHHKSEEDTTNKSGDVTPTKTIWEVMHETDVLTLLNKILARRCATTATNLADPTTSENNNNNNNNHNNNKNDTSSALPQSINATSQISTSALAILQGLYYVPNYYPSRTDHRPHEYDSHGSSDEESYNESLSNYNRHQDDDDDDDDDDVVVANELEAARIKKRRVSHRTIDDFQLTSKPSSMSFSSSSMAIPSKKKPTLLSQKQHPPPPVTNVSMIGRSSVDGTEEHQSVPEVSLVSTPTNNNAATTSSTASSSAISKPSMDQLQTRIKFQFKPKPMKSHQAMIEQEGSMDLPKGVTVRPSRKWQAQTYFAGQSRYVGVYDTSRLAARAYNVVQEYLQSYRAHYKLTKDTPKEEVSAVFADARRVADEAVQRLRQELNMTDSNDNDNDSGVATNDSMNQPSRSVSPVNAVSAHIQDVTRPNEPPLEHVATTVPIQEEPTVDGLDDPTDANTPTSAESNGRHSATP